MSTCERMCLFSSFFIILQKEQLSIPFFLAHYYLHITRSILILQHRIQMHYTIYTIQNQLYKRPLAVYIISYKSLDTYTIQNESIDIYTTQVHHAASVNFQIAKLV